MRVNLLAIWYGWHPQCARMYTKPGKYRAERPVGIDLAAVSISWHAHWTLAYTKTKTCKTKCALGTPSGPLCTPRPTNIEQDGQWGSSCLLYVMDVTPIAPFMSTGPVKNRAGRAVRAELPAILCGWHAIDNYVHRTLQIPGRTAGGYRRAG